MSTIIPVVSSCPGAFGKKPSNVLSGLKHWIILEYVGRPLVDDVDWTKKKSDDASEKARSSMARVGRFRPRVPR